MFKAAGAEAITGGVRGEWSSSGSLRGGVSGRQQAVAVTERHPTQRRGRVGASERRDEATQWRRAALQAAVDPDRAAHRPADGSGIPGRAAGGASTATRPAAGRDRDRGGPG